MTTDVTHSADDNVAASHRRRNFFAVAVLAMMATSGLLELQWARDVPEVVLGLIFVVLGIVGIVWYRKGNPASPSLIPMWLLIAALATRLAAVLHVGAFAGPDAGHTMFLFMATVIYAGQRTAQRRTADQKEARLIGRRQNRRGAA